jgi:hypothetical protein
MADDGRFSLAPLPDGMAPMPIGAAIESEATIPLPGRWI